MPRYVRQKFEGAVYHVITRGNNRQNIFLDEEDLRFFLDILRRYKKKHDFFIYSYVLMTNHLHMLLQTKENNLSEIMHGIKRNYTRYFNNKYKHINHLFHDRFKSIVVDSDNYVILLSKYIHNNPVKAKMVKRPQDYNWSSYNNIIRNIDNKDDLVDKYFILNYFSQDIIKAINKYHNYVTDQEEIFDTFNYNKDLEMFIKNDLEDELRYKVFLNTIINRLEINNQALMKNKSRKYKYVRQMVAYLLKKYYGFKNHEIAKILNLKDNTRVSKIIKQADKDLAESIIKGNEDGNIALHKAN